MDGVGGTALTRKGMGNKSKEEAMMKKKEKAKEERRVVEQMRFKLPLNVNAGYL